MRRFRLSLAQWIASNRKLVFGVWQFFILYNNWQNYWLHTKKLAQTFLFGGNFRIFVDKNEQLKQCSYLQAYVSCKNAQFSGHNKFSPPDAWPNVGRDRDKVKTKYLEAVNTSGNKPIRYKCTIMHAVYCRILLSNFDQISTSLLYYTQI